MFHPPYRRLTRSFAGGRRFPRALRHGGWAALLLLASWAGAAEERKSLRWKLQAGDDLTVQITQTNTLETPGPDRPLVAVVQLAMELTWHVDRVETDGAVQVAQSFTRFVVQTSGPEAPAVAYDSSSTAAPPAEMQELGQAVRRLLGTRCQVTLSARGEITGVQPASETDSLLRPTPGAAGGLRLLTRAGINQTLRPALGLLPPTPVAPGDTWQDAFESDAPAGRIRLVTTYTYQGPRSLEERLVERIDLATEATLPAGKSPLGDTAAPLPQHYRGTLYFDASAGRLVRSELQQTQVAEASYRGKPVQLKASNRVLLRIKEPGNSP